jgi:hypothetical protein
MMGEGIARNMKSRIEINKSNIVASCWSSCVVIICTFVGSVYEMLYCTLATNLKFQYTVPYNINKLVVVFVLCQKLLT